MQIRTLKELRKHVGEQVSVVTNDGFKGKCKVIETYSKDLGLATDSDSLGASNVFWNATLSQGFKPFQWGHYCCYDYQLENELESVKTIERKTRSDKGKKRGKYHKKVEGPTEYTFKFSSDFKEDPVAPVPPSGSAFELLEKILSVLQEINNKM